MESVEADGEPTEGIERRVRRIRRQRLTSREKGIPERELTHADDVPQRGECRVEAENHVPREEPLPRMNDVRERPEAHDATTARATSAFPRHASVCPDRSHRPPRSAARNDRDGIVARRAAIEIQPAADGDHGIPVINSR